MPLTPAQVSLIGSGVNATGGIITNIVNRKNVKETNEQRYKMFREQMQYNDASAQMQRQMAAGLHPMTMSGLQPTDAPSSPDYETFEARNPFSGAIDTGVNISQQMMQEKQMALTEKQIEVQHLKTTVDALGAITALMGENVTTDEALSMLHRITGLDVKEDSEVVQLHRDDVLVNSLSNQIEMSNLSVQEKRTLVDWLDEFKQAEYDLLVARKDETKSQDLLNKINYKVAESVKALNESEREHVDQLTRNLEEQWKSLNFQGELDVQKLSRIREIMGSYIKEIKAKANISDNEATYWVWNKLLENYRPVEFGPIKVGSPYNKTFRTSWMYGHPVPVQ